MESSENMETTSQKEQDQENKRVIDLQDLIERNIKIDKQIESSSFTESMLSIQAILSQANDIEKGYEERQTNATELVLDTELLRRNHEVLGKAIQYSSNFTDRMFCNALNNQIFKDNFENWNLLCDLACQYGVPFYSSASMLPFIDVKPKEQIPKQRAVRKTATNAIEKRPKHSDNLERKSEGSTAVNNVMKQIKHIYRAGNNQPIPYYKLICHPSNFMDSVQNALIVSFLIKENLICIENGNENLPHIRVNTNCNNSASHANHQAICRLDVALCKKFVEHYNIKEPMLKRLEQE